jgi:hypothetical protein
MRSFSFYNTTFIMASQKGLELRVPPLELKENCELECWRDFILRFEIALINTTLALGSPPNGANSSEQAAHEDQLNFKRGGMLLNSIGNDGYRIFTRWKIAAKDIRYDNLVGRYEDQFTGKQNLFVTRHRFLTMGQISSESVETFVDRVTKAASFCKLGDLEDDLVLQMVTRGLKNDKLRKELLSTDKLDLQKAKNICYLFTSAEESSNFLTDKPSAEVATVSRAPTRKGNGSCFICKSKEHWAKDCPKKKDFSCFKCGTKGHIAKHCKKKAVREVQASDDKRGSESESDESF